VAREEEAEAATDDKTETVRARLSAGEGERRLFARL
jgi:hypothetical protein